MTETSLLPKIAAAAGYDFGRLCEAILDGARVHQPGPPLRSSRRGRSCATQDDEGAWLLESVG
jgi:hypothetical protein